ncbi:pacearchaeosortase [Candidatus Pacearchaeota archaeon]|nr:pacearchaeosortase [Candidatus Pacearchaeota archaeon]
MRTREFLDIVVRYALVLASSINSLGIFYLLFTPLTIYPVFWLLSMFYNVSLSGNIISIALSSEKISIELVDACIAGFAYFLLFALNLAARSIKARTRIFSVLFTFFAFLFLNILRIIILSVLYINNFAYFNIVHSLFWNTLSTLFVVGIWFLSARLFRIKEIPGYSDIRFVWRYAKRKR